MAARRLQIVWLVLLAGCGQRAVVPVEELPTAQQTLAAAGVRLSASKSAAELSELALQGDRLLAALSATERDALARGWIRFWVDRPVVVEVAAPEASVPFWLAECGFEPTGERLHSDDEHFVLYRKHFPAGCVGLGVNGLDRSPRSHYAVFVRAAVDEAAAVAISRLQPGRIRAVAARECESIYADAHQAFDRLPERLRAGLLVQTVRAESHVLALVRGRAWKTHVPSGRQPDQVVVSFGSEAATSLCFTWRTTENVTASALRLAQADPEGRNPGPAAGAHIRTLEGDSWPVVTPHLLNDPAIVRHRVQVEDLEPGTAYTYSVGDGTPGGWTDWRNVRTGPASGGTRSAKLLYIGDPQTGLEAWGKLIEQALARNPDAGCMLIAGDLVDRGNERSNWDHLFLRAKNVFDRLPTMPAVGNHEYLDRGPQLYRSFFALPANGPEGIAPGLVYAFRYGDALVAVLDSTLALADPDQAERQARWLDATLAQTTARWRVVMFHHPLYASHPSRESPALRAAWEPVFDRNQVDLVLQGHDHAYLRTYPMRGGRPAEAGERGTVYVVSVSGDKFYGQPHRDYIARGLTHTSTYQVIELSRAKLAMQAFDASGRAVDEFEIAARPERLVLESRQ